MSRFLVPDSAPLGLLTHPQRNAEVAAITELRRELLPVRVKNFGQRRDSKGDRQRMSM